MRVKNNDSKEVVEHELLLATLAAEQLLEESPSHD